METIQLSIIISMASLGFRCITGKGMILYFMRSWLDKKAAWKKEILDEIAVIDEQLQTYSRMSHDIKFQLKNPDYIPLLQHELEALTTAKTMLLDDNLNKYDVLLYAMKPFILCSTCMASVHTLIWFPIITQSFNWSIILVMLIVAFMNTLLFGLIERIQK